MSKVFLIAEIGINHNGDIDLAKQLIDVSAIAGYDAVKFQKRNVEKVYSPTELDKPRESPWGNTTREQKFGIEFDEKEYDEIDRYCKEKGIEWFASAWDPDSLKFLNKYGCKYNKVASAMLSNDVMLKSIAKQKKYTFISTGMHTIEEIENAVQIFKEFDCPFELMHCNSSYPMKNEDANLSMIQVLRERFNCDVGYSGHEMGLQISLAAVAMGATSLERHITIDKTMYGSDQSSSVESTGVIKLGRDVRIIERAVGNGIKIISETEKKIREKLSKPYWTTKI